MIIHGFRIHPELLEGVYAERCVLRECLGACCTGGAWLDVEQLKLIVPHVAAVQGNLPEDRRDPNIWFSAPSADEDSPKGALVGTNVIDDPQRPGKSCCVFLRPDRLCALHVTSDQLGLTYPGLKPLFCALFPLQVRGGEISRGSEVVVDHDTARNFGGALCRRTAEQSQPLYRLYRLELLLLLGEEGYRELEQISDQ